MLQRSNYMTAKKYIEGLPKMHTGGKPYRMVQLI